MKNVEETKVCRNCNEEKPVSAFHTKSNGKPRENCKECTNAKNRAWYYKNLEARGISLKAYRQTIEGRFTEFKRLHQRESGKDFGPYDTLTKEEYREIIEASNWTCANCGDPVTLETLEMDHCTSIKNGGIFHKGNMQVLCSSCNHKKGSKNIRFFKVILVGGLR